MKKLRLFLSVAAILLLGLSLAPVSSAQTFQNGGFEIANPGCTPGFNALGNGDTSVTGWVVGGNGADLICGDFTCSTGDCIDLNGTDVGSISQTFTTIPGYGYIVYFNFSGNPTGGEGYRDLRVTVSGIPVDNDFQCDMSFDCLNWLQRSFSFTATGTSHTLTFASQDLGEIYGPAIDNVIVEVIPTVPTLNEWGVIAFMLLALIVGALYLRMRKTN